MRTPNLHAGVQLGSRATQAPGGDLDRWHVAPYARPSDLRRAATTSYVDAARSGVNTGRGQPPSPAQPRVHQGGDHCLRDAPTQTHRPRRPRTDLVYTEDIASLEDNVGDSKEAGGGSSPTAGGPARVDGLWFYLPLPDRLPVPDGHLITVGLSLQDFDHERFERVTSLEQQGLESLSFTASLEISLQMHHMDLPEDPTLKQTEQLFIWANGRDPDAEPPQSPPTPRSTQTVVEAFVPVAAGAEFEDVASDAFDLSVDAIARVQRAYASLSRKPVRLLTPAALPPIVPVRRGTVGTDGLRGELHAFLIPHDTGDPTPQDSTLGDDDLRELSRRYGDESGRPTLAAMRDLQREAQVQLERDGNYRAAAMTIGIAGEVLMNTVHMVLLWEDCVEPDIAAAEFGPNGTSHFKRVLDVMPRLLGGAWQEGHGPVGRYLAHVVRLRNRVAHRGYRPAPQQARASWDALLGMGEHVLLQLSRHQNLPRYGRAALMLCGNDFLAEHDRLTRRLRRLGGDASEPNWAHAFERWRHHLDRALDPTTAPPGGDPSSLQLMVAVEQSGPTWVVFDIDALHAAEIEDDRVVEIAGPQAIAMGERAGEGLTIGGRARLVGDLRAMPDLNWRPAHEVLSGMPIFPKRR